MQHFASFVNLTKHQQEQERLRFLLGELNHRTQNALATVLALSSRPCAAGGREVINVFERRIWRVEGHACWGRENWGGVSLRDVIGEILRPFGLADGRVARFSVEGDDVRLQPKASLTLAMVFHELATNAVKHGALSDGAAGRIGIVWRVESVPRGDRMRLRWRESGGPPVTPPGRKGFGARLIERGLAQELNGEVRLDYNPAGVICEIVMPVPQGTGG